MVRNKKLFYGIIITVVIALTGGGWLLSQSRLVTKKQLKNFAECAKAGYPILESYPRQCRTPDGKTFVEQITPGRQDAVPEDFNIYYSFGVYEKNILDTKNSLYNKDMVCDPPKEYKIQLNTSERKTIWEATLENNLFNIEEEFTQNCNPRGECLEVTPPSGATLKITANGKIKTIKWRENYFEKNDPQLKKFINVKEIIENIISQKEKEMSVPTPKCGYL